MITLNNLAVKYASGDLVIRDMSVVFTAGSCTALLGKSGAGKTSLLRSIAGLQPYQGTIVVNGKNLGKQMPCDRAHLVGYVFQEFNLFPTLTVLENCVQPLCMVKKMSRTAAIVIAQKWLVRLGMADFYDRMPHELSGGQQQRVALARALCFDPICLLLDEPTAALDPENTSIMCDVIRELCAQGTTVVVVSHDMDFVRSCADQYWLLIDGGIVEMCKKSDAPVCGDAPRIEALLRCMRYDN